MIASLLLSGLVTLSASVADREVHRRFGIAPLPFDRVEASEEGVRIYLEKDGIIQENLVTWDRVASIDPPANGLLEPGLEQKLQLGAWLWRGHGRLLRGDARLALPQFTQAWNELKESRSPLAAMAAEGLVRAAVLRQEPGVAMVPALALADLHAAGIKTDRFDGQPAILDSATGLIPDLPPTLSPEDAALAAQGIGQWMASADEAGRVRGGLLQSLLLRTPTVEAKSNRNENEGTRFLRLLLELESDDSKRRQRARDRLALKLDDEPAWREAWTHFFVGRSLVEKEEDSALRRIGVLELLHVPPFGSAAPPFMVQQALRLAAETSREIGDIQAANLLDALVRIALNRGSMENRP